MALPLSRVEGGSVMKATTPASTPDPVMSTPSEKGGKLCKMKKGSEPYTRYPVSTWCTPSNRKRKEEKERERERERKERTI